MTHVPADRYGRRTSSSTRLLLICASILGVALIGWYLWTVLWAISPKVTSSLGNQPDLETSTTQVTIEYAVRLGDGVKPSDVHCTVTAQAKDSSVVGGPALITPTQAGGNAYVLRISRHAAFIKWDGCTAPGQTNPR